MFYDVVFEQFGRRPCISISPRGSNLIWILNIKIHSGLLIKVQ